MQRKAWSFSSAAMSRSWKRCAAVSNRTISSSLSAPAMCMRSAKRWRGRTHERAIRIDRPLPPADRHRSRPSQLPQHSGAAADRPSAHDCSDARRGRGADLARCVAILRELRVHDPEIYARISEVRPVAPSGYAFFDRQLHAVIYANAEDLAPRWRDFYAIADAEHFVAGDVAYADLRFA